MAGWGSAVAGGWCLAGCLCALREKLIAAMIPCRCVSSHLLAYCAVACFVQVPGGAGYRAPAPGHHQRAARERAELPRRGAAKQKFLHFFRQKLLVLGLDSTLRTSNY